MTDRTPDPEPDDDRSRDDEGGMGFLIGPRDHEDGTPFKWTPEAIRRFHALRYHIERSAKQFGLPLPESIGTNSANPASERSKEITREANPAMGDAEASIRANRQKLRIEHPDGTKVIASSWNLEIKARGALEKPIRALGLLMKRLKWSGRIVLRFGKWLKVTVAASNDNESANVE